MSSLSGILEWQQKDDSKYHIEQITTDLEKNKINGVMVYSFM